MLSKLCKKYEYLFDPKNKDIFLVSSIAEFNQVPPDLQPLILIEGKGKKTHPIKECGEAIVALQEWLSIQQSNIVLVANEAEYGAQDIAMHALRESVAERLLKAEKMLRDFNPNFTLKITDSFRPLLLQKQYFDKVYNELSRQGFEGEDLYNKTTQVIADPDQHPPHSTGGTVDITIHDISTGKDLLMGSLLDDVIDPKARTFHPDVASEARENRIMLYTAMIEAGFVNASSEWWHYSYGDQEWAIHTHAPCAVYDSVVQK